LTGKTSALISNLESGTSYVITIQGVGIAGVGDPTTATIITGILLKVFSVVCIFLRFMKTSFK